MSDSTPSGETVPADGASPSEPPTDTTPEGDGTARPAPSEPPVVKPGLRDRVSALPPVTVLVTGIALGAAATGLLWLGTTMTTGNSESPGGTGPFTARGAITLTDSDGYTAVGETCLGKRGYDDITAGTTVTVSDAAGTVVAVGSLDLGEVTELGCSFPFTVKDVPGGTAFYTVEVSHRGGITKTAAEMHDELAFTLG